MNEAGTASPISVFILRFGPLVSGSLRGRVSIRGTIEPCAIPCFAISSSIQWSAIAAFLLATSRQAGKNHDAFLKAKWLLPDQAWNLLSRSRRKSMLWLRDLTKRQDLISTQAPSVSTVQ